MKNMKYKTIHINTFVYLIAFSSVLFNCSTKKPIIQNPSFMHTKPIFADNDDSVGPNMIHAKVKISEVYKEPQEICGVRKIKVCQIEVTEVLKIGFGLHRGMHRGEKYKVSFTQKDFKIKKGDSLLIKIQELPCFGTDETSSFLVVNSQPI